MHFRNRKFTALLLCSMLLLGKLFALMHIGTCGSATCSISHAGTSSTCSGHQHACSCHPSPAQNSCELELPPKAPVSHHDSNNCSICQSVYTVAIETSTFDATCTIELCSTDVLTLENLNVATFDVSIPSPRGPPTLF